MAKRFVLWEISVISLVYLLLVSLPQMQQTLAAYSYALSGTEAAPLRYRILHTVFVSVIASIVPGDWGIVVGAAVLSIVSLVIWLALVWQLFAAPSEANRLP